MAGSAFEATANKRVKTSASCDGNIARINKKPGLLDLPNELLVETFSYFPVDLHVSLRMRRTVSNINIHTVTLDELSQPDSYANVQMLVLINTDWTEIEAITAV